MNRYYEWGAFTQYHYLILTKMGFRGFCIELHIFIYMQNNHQQKADPYENKRSVLHECEIVRLDFWVS